MQGIIWVSRPVAGSVAAARIVQCTGSSRQWAERGLIPPRPLNLMWIIPTEEYVNNCVKFPRASLSVTPGLCVGSTFGGSSDVHFNLIQPARVSISSVLSFAPTGSARPTPASSPVQVLSFAPTGSATLTSTQSTIPTSILTPTPSNRIHPLRWKEGSN